MPHDNKFTVIMRLIALENAVTELKRENAELRVHLNATLQTAINDARRTIQDDIKASLKIDGGTF